MKVPVFERFLSILCLTAIATLSISGCSNGSDSKKDANLRVLNVSAGYESIDLYANKNYSDNASEADQLRIEATGYEAMSSYVLLDADNYNIKFKRNGATGTLRTESGVALSQDAHVTYVTYGSSGSFGIVRLDEDATEPDSGKSLVNVLNAGETDAMDVYLTDSEASLDDVSPQFSGVTHGQLVSGTQVNSGTYRLRVTKQGDIDDVRLDVAEITLGSETVSSIVLTATEGGVLVNAVIFRQQGSPTLYHNTKARIRGAVGIANGSKVTLNASGVGLLSGAAMGAISSSYSLVESGSVAVGLGVDGTAVSVANQTFAAGTDYTLLVWNDASGTRLSVIKDDNRLPRTSGNAKIRLLNGYSGLGEPLSMSADFAPVAEGIELGAASSYPEIDSGSDIQLDVSNTDTGATVVTRTGVTLSSSSVYTMFVVGADATAATATLRKDR